MNETREWSFEGNGIRTVEIDGEPWFIGKDVAALLGYSNPRKALADHVDEEDKKAGVTIRDGSQGRAMTIINESGVYALIFGSKLPDAKRFKHWVTSEVLPAIRKTGQYKQPEAKPDSYMIDDRVLRAQRWIEETQEWQKTVLRLENKLSLQAPKVALADAITETPGCIHIGDLAKLLRQNGVDTGKVRLFKWMREHDWLCSSKHERNFPTQRAIDRGYMILKEHVLHFNGEEVKRFTPMVTGAGQTFFINWFMKLGKPGRKPSEIAADRMTGKK